MGRDQLAIEARDGRYAGERILVLNGSLNAETVLAFRDALPQNREGTLLLDLSALKHMDSSGLGTLIGTYVSFEQKLGRVLLAGVSERVWDLFRMCKIEDVFTRYPSVAEAERMLGDYAPAGGGEAGSGGSLGG